MKHLFSLIAFIFISLISVAQTDDHATEIQSSVSEFPNLHPLVVHFPLILLIVAAIMQIAVLFLRSRPFNVSVIIITFLGFVTGLLAAFIFHDHPSENISPAANRIFETHEQMAFITLGVSALASIFKIIGLFRRSISVELIALLLLLGAAVTVSIAGHLGSEMVYKHGIGPKGEQLEEKHTH